MQTGFIGFSIEDKQTAWHQQHRCNWLGLNACNMPKCLFLSAVTVSALLIGKELMRAQSQFCIVTLS